MNREGERIQDLPHPARAFWNTPELVAIVLKGASRGTLAACTRVSKTVSDCALDELYYNCPGLFPVLNALCHLKAENKREGVVGAEEEDDDGPLVWRSHSDD